MPISMTGANAKAGVAKPFSLFHSSVGVALRLHWANIHGGQEEKKIKEPRQLIASHLRADKSFSSPDSPHATLNYTNIPYPVYLITHHLISNIMGSRATGPF